MTESKKKKFSFSYILYSIIIYIPLYFLIHTSANNKLGSINIFDFLAFLKDLYAKIAIGISVHPRIIFLHFIFIKYLTAGPRIFSAFLTLPDLTS